MMMPCILSTSTYSPTKGRGDLSCSSSFRGTDTSANSSAYHPRIEEGPAERHIRQFLYVMDILFHHILSPVSSHIVSSGHNLFPDRHSLLKSLQREKHRWPFVIGSVSWHLSGSIGVDQWRTGIVSASPCDTVTFLISPCYLQHFGLLLIAGNIRTSSQCNLRSVLNVLA